MRRILARIPHFLHCTHGNTSLSDIRMERTVIFQGKHLLYLAALDIDNKVFAGVAKKVCGQVAAFRNLGIDAYLLCFSNNQPCLLHGEERTLMPIKSLCGFHAVIQLYAIAVKLCRELEIDLFYYRHPLSDWWLFKSLKKIRSLVDKIVLEIPTYPYDDEVARNHNPVARFSFLQDKFFRTRLFGIVDLVATYVKDDIKFEKIWNIPSIVLSNAISEALIAPIKHVPDEQLQFIAVANLMYHHRYDKFLRGMAEYLKLPSAKHFSFHIVGDGMERPNLELLTKELGLQKFVFFHGIQTGEALRLLLEVSDLALCCFYANTKVETFRRPDTSLKTVEYCAMGLPHTGSEINPYYPTNNSFFYPAETDDTSVDVAPIVEFALNVNRESAQLEMKETVLKNLTWERQMEKVIMKLSTKQSTI